MDIRDRLNTLFTESQNKNCKPVKLVNFSGISLDFSRNIITKDILIKMRSLLTTTKFSQKRKELFTNKLVSNTESRKVSFVSYRNSSLYNKDIDNMAKLYLKFRNNNIKNPNGERITTIVHIGIGGSILGPKFLSEALEGFKDGHFNSHFVSSGDLDEVSDLVKKIDVKSTLFIFVSKSFKSDETMRIKSFIDDYIKVNYPKSASHIYKYQYIAVTANKTLCKKLNFLSQNIFALLETIPGRFSVASPVSLIIMFEIGIDKYRELIKGIQAMDRHFYKTKFENNLPVTLALVNIWNINFLSKYANIIVPYSFRLRSFSNYVQQIEMESNGKSIMNNKEMTLNFTSPVVFGYSGTECQHSFFQAVHQGTVDVFLDFLYVKNLNTDSKKFLAANVFAQADLLFKGKKTKYPHKDLIGCSPSCLVGIDKLSPDRIGKLMSLYEHKVFVEGTIWQINSYDQWGVEEGKILAKKNLSKN